MSVGLNEIYDKPVWLFEYDIPSAWSKNVFHDGKTIQELAYGYSKADAKFFQDLRNGLIYQLKTDLKAAKNLYSSWIVEESKIDEARKLQQHIREELINKGFSKHAEKVNLFPIFSTQEGFRSYEERKAEFYLEYLSEVQEGLSKADDKLKENTLKLNEISQAVWRAKKALDIVNEMKETLEDKTSEKSRYNEINDLSLTVEAQRAEIDLKLSDAKEKQKIEKAEQKAQLKASIKKRKF
jgi:hypothetical protein